MAIIINIPVLFAVMLVSALAGAIIARKFTRKKK